MRLPDLHTWGPDDVLDALVQAGVVDSETAQSVGTVDRETVRDLLAAKGYDSIVYPNATEGGGDSWIVFDPDRIRPAYLGKTAAAASGNIWLGATYHNGYVTAVPVPSQEYDETVHGHGSAGVGVHGRKWRYRDGVPWVFWWDFSSVTPDEKTRTEDYLARRGRPVHGHRWMNEFCKDYDGLTGDQLTHSTDELAEQL